MSSKTSDRIKLRLHYWNCRGRVQAVRYILEDLAYTHQNIDYKEDFEYVDKPFQIWLQHKNDEKISGSFHNLPVLHWNDTDTFGQTLPLAQLLARKFDLYGQTTPSIDDKDLLQSYIDGAVSCSYTDIISNVLTGIWNSVDFVDEKNPLNRLTKTIPNSLAALDRILTKSSTSFFYDQFQPTIADYFVFEAFTLTCAYNRNLLPKEDDCQALMKLEQSMKERPGLANYFKRGLLFKTITGAPTEGEYRKTISKTQE